MMHHITVPRVLQACVAAKQALQHARFGFSLMMLIYGS